MWYILQILHYPIYSLYAYYHGIYVMCLKTYFPKPMKYDRPLLRAMVLPLLAFSTIVLFGIWGYVYLAGIGVIEAAFWLVDPTSLELHGASDTVKAFSILVMIGLVITGVWIVESVLSATFGGQIQEELKQMKIDKEINEVTDHVVVCGYGMFGRTIAEKVANTGRDVVILENDEWESKQALDNGHLAIHGDARREADLLAAGINRAQAVVTAVDDSNTNIQTAILVSELAKDVRLVVRVGEEMYSQLAIRAGADEVIIPEVISATDVVDDYL